MSLALFEDTFPPYVPFGSRNLTGGQVGTDVAVLQTIYNQSLKVMNPPLGPLGQPIPLTGVYDAATIQAVKNVQAFYGLAVDGIAGPATYFAFGQGVGSNVTYGGPAYGSRSLSQGSSGGDVTVLQNRLNLFRYSALIGAPADGVFGAKTAAAVLQFKLDAIANGDTGLANNSTVGSGAFDATWIYTYAGGRGLFSGRNGFDVVFVQNLLKKLGFYGGPVQGYYDAPTQAAVTAFQRANGIAADGTVGPATFFKLGQNNLVPAPQPYTVPPITPVSPQMDCCFPLTPTSSATALARGVFFTHNGPVTGPGSAAVQWIAAALLAPPSSYGSQFTQYGFSLNSPGVFTALTQCTALPSGDAVWTAAFESAAAGPLTSAAVTIAPLTAAGAAGPVVLSGSGSCPFTASASSASGD